MTTKSKHYEEYENLFELVENPFVAAREFADKEDEGQVPGSLLDGTTEPVRINMDEEGLLQDGHHQFHGKVLG